MLKKILAGIAALSTPPAPNDLAQSLSAWYQTPVGEALLAMEREQSFESLHMHSGFRAMLLEVTDRLEFLADGPQLHKFSVTNRPGADCAAVSDFDALPLPSNLVDVVLMHHVLDYCPLPHESLKEAARVVAPAGHLVIFGFNPFSWMGLLKWPLRLMSRNCLWQCRMLTRWRIGDWLKLLGFQVETVSYGAFAPPLQSRRLLRGLNRSEGFCRKAGLPFGAYYMIVARKQVLRPLVSHQPAWLARAIKPVQRVEVEGAPHRQLPDTVETQGNHCEENRNIYRWRLPRQSRSGGLGGVAALRR